MLKPNRRETEEAVGTKITTSATAIDAGFRLCYELDLEAAVITLDRDGMVLKDRTGPARHFPSTPREVFDELRRETRADEDGRYRFENVPPGNYHVGVRAEGYSTRRTEVTVGPAASTLDIAVEFDLRVGDEVEAAARTARHRLGHHLLDGRRPHGPADGAEQELAVLAHPSSVDARRRWFGAFFLILSLGMLIWGVTLLAEYLVKHPILFLAYWGMCAFFTGLALINALLDMIIMRKRTRDEQTALAEKSFGDIIEAEKKKRRL